MTAPAKLAAFAFVVVAAFALGYGAGELAGPFDDDKEPVSRGGHEHEWGEQ